VLLWLLLKLPWWRRCLQGRPKEQLPLAAAALAAALSLAAAAQSLAALHGEVPPLGCLRLAPQHWATLQPLHLQHNNSWCLVLQRWRHLLLQLVVASTWQTRA
jgi:hypothetical protein